MQLKLKKKRFRKRKFLFQLQLYLKFYQRSLRETYILKFRRVSQDNLQAYLNNLN